MKDEVIRIKEYLQKLSDDTVDLYSLKKQFQQEFSDVDPEVILKAEQELIDEQVGSEKLSKLCDLHSSLFHGMMQEEKKTCASCKLENQLPIGHPMNIFYQENEEIEGLLKSFEPFMQENDTSCLKDLEKIQAIFTHYARKGDLLYPLLSYKYHIQGPSDVMWTKDDEIRDGLKKYIHSLPKTKEEMEEFKMYLESAHEMIYKENNILYPMVLKTFSKEDFMKIYEDNDVYESCFIPSYPKWDEAEEQKSQEETIEQHMKHKMLFENGSLTFEQVEGILNTIPMELSFVDVNDINRYFNEGDKLLKRSKLAIDRPVRLCHPVKIQKMVDSIISSLREKEKESVDVFATKNNTPILIRYIRVEDRNHDYLGTLECVLDLTMIYQHLQVKS